MTTWPTRQRPEPAHPKPTAAQREAEAREESDRGVRMTLKKLGLEDPREALLCLPDSYADLRTITRELPEDADVDPRLYALTYTGVMLGFDKNKKPVNMDRKELWKYVRRVEMLLRDARGDEVTWSAFDGPWPYKDLVAGEQVGLVARFERFGKRGYLSDVQRPPAHAIGSIWVKYLGIAGQVAGENVERMVNAQVDNPEAYRRCVAKVVGAIGLREDEALRVVGCTEFVDVESVVRGLHRPKTVEEGWAARKVANKLSAAAVQASALRHNLRAAHPQSPLPVDISDLEALARTQREKLSNDQRKAATAILNGLKDPKPLNSLLSGDVGTGKTLAFLLPAVAAHRAGAKVAIIAPTSILADQIAMQVISRFGPMVKGVERIVAGGKISDQQSILVGTPGLTSVCSKAKYVPNVLICDEQHKLSATDREKLVKPWTHVIEVSATPVPRSLASALFGGKQVINIRECPVQKNIQCLVGDLEDRRKFGGMLKWALDNGQRAAVVYPLVDGGKRAGEDGDDEVASVLSGAKALEAAFPGKVVVVHGKMKDEEIEAALKLVRSGERPLVVASTVIETGVDIPGITALVVRNADRFGISQLHQLRGRLARHGGDAWFGMMVDSLEELPAETRMRLETVASCQDGYELAERDLVLRGFGDVEGVAQSGASETVFRLVRLRPEDFLKNKLSDMAVQAPAAAAAEQESDQRRADQPRLFA